MLDSQSPHYSLNAVFDTCAENTVETAINARYAEFFTNNCKIADRVDDNTLTALIWQINTIYVQYALFEWIYQHRKSETTVVNHFHIFVIDRFALSLLIAIRKLQDDFSLIEPHNQKKANEKRETNSIPRLINLILSEEAQSEQRSLTRNSLIQEIICLMKIDGNLIIHINKRIAHLASNASRKNTNTRNPTLAELVTLIEKYNRIVYRLFLFCQPGHDISLFAAPVGLVYELSWLFSLDKTEQSNLQHYLHTLSQHIETWRTRTT
jgi:hypothetical protein